MTWARVTLTAGLLVLLATFAVGTEHELSASVDGRIQACGISMPSSWLVSGTPAHLGAEATVTDDERRAAAACAPVVRRSRMLLLSAVGVGGLLALVGWTGVSTRREDAAPSVLRTVST